MYCYQGKEHFCSILFASQKPENVKTILVKYLLGDPENCELSCCFFICCSLPLPHQWWTNVNFRGTGGGGGGEPQVEKAQVTRLFISWSDTILREISTFSSAFPKGDPAKTTWQTSACQMQAWAPRCIPHKHLQMKWQAWTASLISSGLCFASSKSRIQKVSII